MRCSLWIRNFFLSLILFFPTISIWGEEIQLQSGDIVFATILEEKKDFLKVRWKERIYKIPREEIVSIDKENLATNGFYPFAEIQLKNGQILKGTLTEDSDKQIVLKTKSDLIKIEKKTIQKLSNIEVADSKMGKYLQTEPDHPPTNLGFVSQIPIRKAYNDDYEVQPVSNLGFFLEPGRFQYSEGFRIGFIGEYIQIRKNNLFYRIEPTEYLNANIYQNATLHLSPQIGLYFLIGAGLSFQNQKGSETIESRSLIPDFNFNGFIAVGVQAIYFEKFLFRFGYKANSILGNQGILLQGIEISLGTIL